MYFSVFSFRFLKIFSHGLRKLISANLDSEISGCGKKINIPTVQTFSLSIKSMDFMFMV